ncbi:MAG: threonylcarbamoyl-AMP synthase [Nitrospirae bacterium]|nr:threonylcarbamoyl-AMP synthase [Nitrospirota bacterium]
MILKLTHGNLKETVTLGVSILNKGGIIAYPTETFYGLGVKYDIEPSLKRLYEIKKRPMEKAMPLIIGSVEQLSLLTDSISDSARALIDRFWPGPLTILFEARSALSEYIVSENKVAVRIPGESFALRLAMAAGFPITATSANISGMPPALSAALIQDYFNDSLDLIIDAGKSTGASPSTIVDVTGNKLRVLRKGAIDICLS